MPEGLRPSPTSRLTMAINESLFCLLKKPAGAGGLVKLHYCMGYRRQNGRMISRLSFHTKYSCILAIRLVQRAASVHTAGEAHEQKQIEKQGYLLTGVSFETI